MIFNNIFEIGLVVDNFVGHAKFSVIFFYELGNLVNSLDNKGWFLKTSPLSQ